MRRIAFAGSPREVLYGVGFVAAVASLWTFAWGRSIDLDHPPLPPGCAAPVCAQVIAHLRAEERREAASGGGALPAGPAVAVDRGADRFSAVRPG